MLISIGLKELIMAGRPSRIKRKARKKTRRYMIGYMTNAHSRTCKECGSHKKLTKHHKIPKSEGGTNEPRNIYYICRDCHDKIHNMTPKIKRKAKK